MSHRTSDEQVNSLDWVVGPLFESWRLFQALFLSGDCLLQRAPVFFLLLERLVADDIILSLARLLDRENVCGHDTFVMARAIRDLGCVPGSADEVRLQTLLLQFKAQAQVVMDHRHNRLSHNNYDTIARGDWSNLQTPKIPEIAAAMDALSALTTAIAEVAYGGSVALNVTLPDNSSAAGQILGVLRNAAMWIDLRTRADSMTDAEVLRVVKRGVFDE